TIARISFLRATDQPHPHPPTILLQRRTPFRRDAVTRHRDLPPERLLHLDVFRLLQLRRVARQVPPRQPRHPLQEPELDRLGLRQHRQDRQARRLVHHAVQPEQRPDLPARVTGRHPPPPPAPAPARGTTPAP